MSEKNLNVDTVEVLEEVSYSNNGLAKVAVVGAVIALGIATVVIIKKRRAAKADVLEVEYTEEKSSKSNK